MKYTWQPLPDLTTMWVVEYKQVYEEKGDKQCLFKLCCVVVTSHLIYLSPCEIYFLLSYLIPLLLFLYLIIHELGWYWSTCMLKYKKDSSKPKSGIQYTYMYKISDVLFLFLYQNPRASLSLYTNSSSLKDVCLTSCNKRSPFNKTHFLFVLKCL